MTKIIEKLNWGKYVSPLSDKNIPPSNWYSFKRRFGSSLATKIYEKFGLSKGDTILDPFLGGATTLIQAKLDRAIAVSIYLFVSEMIELGKQEEIKDFVEFFVKFYRTIKWQIPKGVEMDKAYYDLLKFQTNISQAAGEKSSIQKRHDFLNEYYYHYNKEKEKALKNAKADLAGVEGKVSFVADLIKGDKEYYRYAKKARILKGIKFH